MLICTHWISTSIYDIKWISSCAFEFEKNNKQSLKIDPGTQKNWEYVENIWLVNFKILPGFRQLLNRSFNMKSCHAIWRFITKKQIIWFYNTGEIHIKTILSGTSSSIRTKLWWNSHLMVLFQPPDTILEEDHPMAILSNFGSNWATQRFQTRRFLCEFPIGSYVKLCLAVVLSHQDGCRSAVALLLKAALIQVSDYELLGASGCFARLHCNLFN
jgi:hypothetical protein